MPKWSTPIAFLTAFFAGVLMLWRTGGDPGPVLSFVMLGAGLVLLIFGADYMVHGAATLARRLGVSPFFIGVTIVAFGTSAPELAASVGAAVKGKGELAIGNVLGSNIANICLILGVTALIRPVPVERSIWRVDAPIMLVITILASFTMLDRLIDPGATIGRIDGLLLVAGLAAYVWYNAKAGRIDPAEIEQEVEIELPSEVEDAEHPRPTGLAGGAKPAMLMLAGLAGLILGAELLVDGATSIAAAVGVSEAIIGLTVVAFGTSVPELVFSARAAMKDHPEIAIGNIIGSNVFNLLSVLGVAALVRPIAIPDEAVERDIWVVWGATTLCWLVMKSRRRVSRVEGAILLAAYAGYTAFLYIR